MLWESYLLIILRLCYLILLEPFHGLLDVHKFVTLVVGHLPEDHLVNVVVTEEHRNTPGLEGVHIWRAFSGFFVGREQVVDVLLSLFHHVNVLGKTYNLLTATYPKSS